MIQRIKKTFSQHFGRRKNDYDENKHQRFEQTLASCYADEMWDSRSFMAL